MVKKRKVNFLINLLVFFKKNILIGLGLVFILTFLVWKYYKLRILSFNTNDVKIESSSNINPIHIKSYPIGIDVEIESASIVNGVWQVYPNSANHLDSSANINDGSNIIIYGHNRDDILGPIRHISLGSEIVIKGSDGLEYVYVVTKTDIVTPDNLEYLKATDKEKLTIYTCTGFLDLKRFIVVAEKKNLPNKQSLETPKVQKVGFNIGKQVFKDSEGMENSDSYINPYITYYGFNDNDPPGKDIAYPKKDGYRTLHNEAGGTGTFDDPISFASSTDLFAIGAIVYVPYIKKYAIMEDYCQTCSKNIKSGRKHIDIWAGGNGSDESELIKCEESYTRDSEKVIINPKNNYQVDTTPLCFR